MIKSKTSRQPRGTDNHFLSRKSSKWTVSHSLDIIGRRKQRTHNSGLAKVAVQCSADTFVVNQTLILRINICGKNRHLRQAANRYRQCY